MLFHNHRSFISKDLRDYINRTTQESIKRLTERQKNNFKIINPLEDDDKNPKPNFYGFLVFLSISSIAFCFYKRLR